MGQSFDILHHHGILSAPAAERMKKAVGFRNIAVQAYRQIDWQIVYSILHERLSDFETFAREIVKATNGFPADERR